MPTDHMVPDPYPWLGFHPAGGTYCTACGNGIADAADPAEHDTGCPNGPRE